MANSTYSVLVTILNKNLLILYLNISYYNHVLDVLIHIISYHKIWYYNQHTWKLLGIYRKSAQIAAISNLVYNKIQYNTIQYNTTQYNIIQYNTIHNLYYDEYVTETVYQGTLQEWTTIIFLIYTAYASLNKYAFY